MQAITGKQRLHVDISKGAKKVQYFQIKVLSDFNEHSVNDSFEIVGRHGFGISVMRTMLGQNFLGE